MLNGTNFALSNYFWFFAVDTMGRWGGGKGGDSRFQVTEGFLGVEIFYSRIFLVSISSTWGFFAYSKQFEVAILMLLMKQKMFLGVPSVVWVL